MNELFDGYCYNGLASGSAKVIVSLKAYILHMDTVIEWNCSILDDKAQIQNTGNSWVDDIGDIMRNEVDWCKLHVDNEGKKLLEKKEIKLYDIICELLNKKYKDEYDSSSDKDAFSVESDYIVFHTPRDSDSDSD